MSIQKFLPVARKMGEENFSAYKQYSKNVRKADGQKYTTSLDLRGVSLMDTVSFTPKAGMALPKGFKDLLNEIYKMYFPRLASENAQKKVVLTSQKFDKNTIHSSIEATTSDEKGVVGKTLFVLKKQGAQYETNIESFLEGAKLKLAAILNFEGLKPNEHRQINLPWNSLRFAEQKDNVLLSVQAPPCEEVGKFDMELLLPKKMVESFFNGEFEKALPELVEKTGVQF